MNRTDIAAALRTLIAERTQNAIAADDIKPDESLLEGERFALDSLDKLHLLVAIESELPVSFNDRPPTDSDFRSLDALTDFVLAAVTNDNP